MEGELLVSTLAGITVDQVERMLYGDASAGRVLRSKQLHDCEGDASHGLCHPAVDDFGHATIASTPASKGSSGTLDILSRGRNCSHWAYFDGCYTTLCESSPAFFALMLETIVDGAVTMGIQRPEALKMAGHGMRGTVGLVLMGEHLAVVRRKVTTPGGSTIRGGLVMEEGRLRATLANALTRQPLPRASRDR